MGKKFILPLLASLTVAVAVSVPAVAASISQRDENAESVLNYNPKVRQNRFDTKLVSDTQDFADPYLAFYYVVDSVGPVYFDSVVPLTTSSSSVSMSSREGYKIWAYVTEETETFVVNLYFNISDSLSQTSSLYLDGYEFTVDDVYTSEEPYDFSGNVVLIYNVDATYTTSDEDLAYSLISGERQLLWLSQDYTYSQYMNSHQVVSGIEAGLPFVSNAAQALVGGFDAMALDNGALTNVMAFSFTLLGLGCAVGICKKVFSWITGRHGM